MGGKADKPDYGPMMDAANSSMRMMGLLGQQQLDESRRQYDLAMPYLSRIADTQSGIMQQTADQGAEYYNYMRNTFRPVEEKMVADAMAYNTEAKREELARQAARDVGLAFQQTQGMTDRAMAAQGVNPNSPAAMAMRQKNQLGLAAQRANAMNSTRTQAEALGYARMADATGLGRGLPGASAGAYQVAVGAGDSAGRNFQQPGQFLMQGLNQGGQFIGQGLQMNNDMRSRILGTQESIYNNSSNPWTTLAGFGATYMLSSKKAKVKTGEVDAQGVSKEVERLPVDQWRYKPGMADGGTVAHVGPYAEDMALLGAASPDGRAIDVINALGLSLAASKGLGQRLTRLEQQQNRGAAQRREVARG